MKNYSFVNVIAFVFCLSLASYNHMHNGFSIGCAFQYLMAAINIPFIFRKRK